MPITLIGNEDVLPYQRPPLSKAYLLGKIGQDALWLRTSAFLADQAIETVLGRGVVAIDRANRNVTVEDGRVIRYDHLVLATGARNRTLPISDAERGGVFSLRSLRDADALRGAMENRRTAVVVGAGFIGLEFAAVARSVGLAVTVVEAASRPMERAVSPETAEHFRQRHEARDVQFHFGRMVTRIVGEDGAKSVQLDDGSVLTADLVLVAVGVVPNTGLAEAAGLAIDNGIVVDAQMRTSDPAISAAGDCTNGPNAFLNRPIRLESVHNANEQAKILAARLAGLGSIPPAVPWFWSDQGPDKLQIAGIAIERQVQLRLETDAERFSVLFFNGGRLACVESVNRPADHHAARQLLQAGVLVSEEQARKAGFTLTSFLARFRR